MTTLFFFEPKIQVDSNKNPPDMQNTQEDYINKYYIMNNFLRRANHRPRWLQREHRQSSLQELH